MPHQLTQTTHPAGAPRISLEFTVTEIEQFFLALDVPARRARFWGSMSDDILRGYAEKIGTANNTGSNLQLVGLRADGLLIGLAEVHLQKDGMAEIALAISADYCGQGLGARLLTAALSAAHQRGARAAQILTECDNAAMRGTAVGCGMHGVRGEPGTWTGELDMDEGDQHFPSVFQLATA